MVKVVTIQQASKADVDAAIAKASYKGQREWAAKQRVERARILRRAVDILRAVMTN